MKRMSGMILVLGFAAATLQAAVDPWTVVSREKGTEVTYEAVLTGEVVRMQKEAGMQFEAAQRAYDQDREVLTQKRQEAKKGRDADLQDAEKFRREAWELYQEALSSGEKDSALKEYEGALKDYEGRKRRAEGVYQEAMERIRKDEEDLSAVRPVREVILPYGRYASETAAKVAASDLNLRYNDSRREK